MRSMFARAVTVSAVSAVALLTIAASRPTQKPKGVSDRVARGEYLVRVMACSDCHTPFKMGAHGPEPDMTLMLSGHPEKLKMPPAPAPVGPWIWSGAATNTAFAGPWGVSYAANLTPDKESGLGAAWSEERFIQALRTGKHIGVGRPIMPPMPWPAFGQMNDSDLRAIWAYLRTIKPIRNFVPDYQPPANAPAR